MKIDPHDFDLQVLWRYEVVYRGHVQAASGREAEHKAASSHMDFWPVEVNVEPKDEGSDGTAQREGS